MMKKNKKKFKYKHTFYSFNGAKFDNTFLLQHLLKIGEKVKTMGGLCNSKVIIYKNLLFKDIRLSNIPGVNLAKLATLVFSAYEKKIVSFDVWDKKF